MKSLITGATGFIGNHLVRRLSNEGDVRCLVRRNSDRTQIGKFDIDQVEGDILNRESLRNALSGVDVVYHLAGAITGLSKNDFHRANVLGCRNVAQEAAHQPNPPVIVYVSSMAAGGPATKKEPRRERERPAPVSIYGRTKLSGELEFHRVANKAPTTIVRPSVVYGEGDRSTLEFFKPILKGRNLVLGDPEWRFSLIEVRDLVDLFVLAAKGERIERNPNRYGVGQYYASGDEAPTLAAFGQHLADALGVNSPRMSRVPAAFTMAYGAISSMIAQVTRKPTIMSYDKARELTRGPWHVSNEKARAQLNFQQKIGLQEGLENAVRWYRRHHWL